MTESNNRSMVDAILLNLENGSKTEADAIAECGSLAQSQSLNWECLYRKDEALYRKVKE